MEIFQTLGIFLLFLTLFSCGSHTTNPPENTYTGILTKTGMTTYQYGTHTLTNDSTFYALRSTEVSLDDYLNQNITITAKEIDGYPVEGGPAYLDVQEIME
ncbi:MAG: hypothetical protein WBG71_06335 [Leeuwenhoekiella sp.]